MATESMEITEYKIYFKTPPSADAVYREHVEITLSLFNPTLDPGNSFRVHFVSRTNLPSHGRLSSPVIENFTNPNRWWLHVGEYIERYVHYVDLVRNEKPLVVSYDLSDIDHGITLGHGNRTVPVGWGRGDL